MFDWVEWVLYSIVGILLVLMVALMFSDNRDPCDTPENKLTKDYLVCKRKIEQDNADAALITTTVIAASTATMQ